MKKRAILAAAALLAACQPDLGTCDADRLAAATHPIYYDVGGYPAYPGQALVDVSCGSGQFCHAEGIAPEDRRGAPAGMDFYVAVAFEPDQQERLRRAHEDVLSLRGAIYEQVAAGAMPPPPPASDEPLAEGARVAYVANPGTPEQRSLPAIDSDEGLEILRGWLACGAPVVAAVEGPEPDFGDVVARMEPRTACPEGQTDCGGACVDVSADASHCGGCGLACGASQACTAGSCECVNDALVACGSECVDLQASGAHCGSCGSACGDRFCASGSCVDACPVGTSDCAGACVELMTSPAHCGTCGNACGSGEACEAGACSCAGGRIDCGGTCVDTATDVRHCGGCGIACGDGGTCSGGSCTCGSGATRCGSACVDTATDLAHCGGCGVTCPAGDACAGGACTTCGPAVSFSGEVQPIFTAECASSRCHGGVRPGGGVDLTAGRAYAELVGVPASCGSAPLVTPGDVSRSYLWNKLTGTNMCSGNQMPKQGSLTASELAIIESWICGGAAND